MNFGFFGETLEDNHALTTVPLSFCLSVSSVWLDLLSLLIINPGMPVLLKCEKREKLSECIAHGS